MFIKKDAKLIVDLCKSYLPNLLAENEDIIIAGGFALNAFAVSEAISSIKESPLREVVLSSLSANPVIPFGDVDLWMTNNPSGQELQHLFSKMEKTGIDSSDHISFGGGDILHLQRTSDWANTFTFSSPKRKKTKTIQCIVKRQTSPEELLSSFDLGVCSIGIYRGEFIIHRSFFESMEKKELVLNARSSYKYKSLSSRVFQALRHFKYNKKMNFDFSKELYSDILGVMNDANQFWIEAQKSEMITSYGSLGKMATPISGSGPFNGRVHVGGKVKITTSSNYEQEVEVKESLTSMIRGLACHFSDLQKMKHWDISHALFLQDSPIIPVKSILEKEFKKNEPSSSIDKYFQF